MRQWILGSVLVTALLAGCGSADNAAGATDARPAAAASRGDASAAEVADEARGKVRCPAKPRTAARPAGAPVDDVIGVRPGLAYDEAVNLILCTHDLLVVQDAGRGFRIETHGQPVRQGFTARFAQDRVQRSSQQIMREMQDSAMARSSNRRVQDMAPGDAKWYVATMGMPGEERVISVAREEWFEEGRHPTADSIEQSLIAKYGTPTNRTHEAGLRTGFVWAYDLRSRPILESSPLHRQCQAQADPDAGNNFSPDCGIVVAATINLRRDNPDLGEYLQVTVVDQAGGYAAIAAAEQGLQQQETRRRAMEVEQASSSADGPTL